MDIKSIGAELEELHKQGRTDEILRETERLLGEIYGWRAWAHYRRKEFEKAEVEAQRAGDNETALKCLAAIAAYHYQDQELVKRYTNRLSDSPAKDNAKTIAARNPDDDTPREKIIRRAEKWNASDPWDPLSTANLSNNTARWLIEKGDGKKDLIDALYFMMTAVDLYGDGENNLHHRAGAYFWVSKIREELYGREGAVYAASMSVHLWAKQLVVDPDNKNFQDSFAGAKKHLEELTEITRY